MKGNLFDSHEALVHCVSRDFAMSAGISKTFNTLYGGKDELINQHVHVGQVAFLKRDKYIYYMVTKEKYWQKPTYDNVRLCLIDLFRLCQLHGVNAIAMPKIGCGLDKLEWDKVKQIIMEEAIMKVYVYTL